MLVRRSNMHDTGALSSAKPYNNGLANFSLAAATGSNSISEGSRQEIDLRRLVSM